MRLLLCRTAALSMRLPLAAETGQSIRPTRSPTRFSSAADAALEVDGCFGHADVECGRLGLRLVERRSGHVGRRPRAAASP